MGSSQIVLLLLTGLLTLTSARPLDKRDSPTHQIIQLTSPSHVSDPLSHSETLSASSSLVGGLQPLHEVHDHGRQLTPLKKTATPKTADETIKRKTGERKSLKKAKKSNAELFQHLGMSKLRSPSVNHHRKRLASQSRKTHHQKSSSDSKMFVIKLPPHPYYYSHHDLNGYDVLEPQPKSVNNVPVNFKTNGKPSRVYHWNIPVIKKMVARKAGSSKSAVFADSDVFSIDKQATWNETDDDKALYRKATYYGLKKPSKHAFRKYFAGNGKPHSFYVMEKNKKPMTVHRLLP